MVRAGGDEPLIAAGRRLLRIVVSVVLLILAAAGVLVVAQPTAVNPASSPCVAFGAGPVNNGKAVIAAGVALHIPEDGIVAGLTAAMQETGLRNLANPNVPASLAAANDGLAIDGQAVGILQQAPWWGPAHELMSPAVAAAKFFTSLRGLHGWEAMTPAQVAVIVQRSARPDTYLDDVPAARRFYRDHLHEVLAAGCGGRQAVRAAAAPLVGAASW